MIISTQTTSLMSNKFTIIYTSIRTKHTNTTTIVLMILSYNTGPMGAHVTTHTQSRTPSIVRSLSLSPSLSLPPPPPPLSLCMCVCVCVGVVGSCQPSIVLYTSYLLN